MVRQAVAAPLLLALCAALAIASPARGTRLEVEIHGLDGERLDNARLLLSIRQRAGDDAPPPARLRQLFARGRQEIANALEPFGFYRAEVDGTLSQREDGVWVARYEVTEGPPLEVATADVRLVGEGSDDAEFARRAREFPLRAGDVLDQRLWEQGKQSLAAYAARSGYFDARFATAAIRIDLARYRADLDLEMRTGPRYRFGEIELSQRALEPSLVRSYADFDSGDPFELGKLLDFETALGGSGYFENVQARPLPDEAHDDRVPIAVDLRFDQPRKWELGGGYGTDTGPRVTAALELRRLNRSGHHARVEARASGIERSVAGSYFIPGAHADTDLWTIDGGWENLDLSTSDSQSSRLGARLTHLLGAWTQTVGLGFESTQFEIGPDDGRSKLVIPEISWSRTRADDDLYPLSGSRLELRLRGASDSLLADASFLRARAAAKLVHEVVGERLRLLARAEVGALRTTDFHELPPTIRFFAGGDRSVRGYGYQELTPRTAAGEPLGGERLAVASVELDSLFFRAFDQRFGAAVFFDVGNAMDSLSGPYERGAGVGLRWLSPVGLVRADAAWALDRPGTPIRFHLTIGPDL